MSWKTELIEILPDGTERYKSTRVEEARTFGKNWWRYIMAVNCPSCGRRGGLVVHYFRNTIYSKWNGPYFRIQHDKFSKEMYHRLRNEGVERVLARTLSHIHLPYCYIGKNYPGHIPVDIPEPPEGA